MNALKPGLRVAEEVARRVVNASQAAGELLICGSFSGGGQKTSETGHLTSKRLLLRGADIVDLVDLNLGSNTAVISSKEGPVLENSAVAGGLEPNEPDQFILSV